MKTPRYICSLMASIPTLPTTLRQPSWIAHRCKGVFDISARHFLDFIYMTPSLHKNDTAELAYVTVSGSGRVCGQGSDHGFVMPVKSNFQAANSAINNKYFRVSEWGYVPTAEYKRISKAQQQAFYRLHDERGGISMPSDRAVTSKEDTNLKHHISELSKKVDYLITMEEPSGDEDGDKKKNAKFRGGGLTHP